MYASPPCYLHEFETDMPSNDVTFPEAPPSTDWPDVRAWRKQVREALIGERTAMPPHLRKSQGAQARRRLVQSIDLHQFPTLGIYWPIRGEINIRDLVLRYLECGGRVALPVVVARASPVEFWAWKPGTRMTRGLWDIPIPETRELVQPDALIVPLVGFDTQGYRLGYGGGYYDRTLAAASKRPYCIGLGYGEGRLKSICPQPHDIPMDAIVTDRLFLQVNASAPVVRS